VEFIELTYNVCFILVTHFISQITLNQLLEVTLIENVTFL